jgi:hypothetical protein
MKKERKPAMATPLVPTVAIPLRDWAKTFTNHHLLGMSAAIDGDTLAIGQTKGRVSRVGYVWIFERQGDQWVEAAEIPADPDHPSAFGLSLALSGDVLAVGDFFEHWQRVHFHRRVARSSATTKGQWVEEGDIHDPHHAFGFDLAFAGKELIAASFDKVLVYELGVDGWQEQTVLPPGASTFSRTRVACDGTTLLIGSYREHSPKHGAPEAGALYVYEKDPQLGWVERDRILAPEPRMSDQFGRDVALSGDTALVSSMRCWTNANEWDFLWKTKADEKGVAYVLGRDAKGKWRHQAILKASDGNLMAGVPGLIWEWWPWIWCMRLILVGDTALVSGTDQRGMGAVYAFRRSGSVWRELAKLQVPDGEVGDYLWPMAYQNGEVFLGAHYLKPEPSGRQSVFVARIGV